MRMLIIRVAVLALIAAASVAVSADGQAKSPFQNIKVQANTGSVTVKCPMNIIFTGNIVYNLPFAKGFVFNYHWGFSDGSKPTNPTLVKNPAGNMDIVKHTWNIKKSGSYTITLFADSGTTHQGAGSDPAVNITCK
jgi:hypothetical protein